MTTLILDIETVGENWRELDGITQSVLTRWLSHSAKNEEEKEALLLDIKKGLGFSPLTGFIVAIGLYDLERKKGVVYYTGESGSIDHEEGEYVLKERSESQMLTEFWDGAKHYDTYVTFNGRCFDIPFIIHRSIAQGVKPSKNLMEGRYPYQQKSCRHVDLQDELTFFGAMQRRPSLHLFCRAFGIESPKGEVSGDDVAELFAGKKFSKIATYNARDVIATTAVYKKWQDYLSYGTPEQDIDF
jgi:uncharacterized protein YprB with RNaseH-like and TPR domain